MPDFLFYIHLVFSLSASIVCKIARLMKPLTLSPVLSACALITSLTMPHMGVTWKLKELTFSQITTVVFPCIN